MESGQPTPENRKLRVRTTDNGTMKPKSQQILRRFAPQDDTRPLPNRPMSVLTQLVNELNTGSLKIVDLTQPLGPDTPVIGLPPQFGQSPRVTMEVISCFDDKGPAWYWNVLH